MKQLAKPVTTRGDTIIEVMLAMTALTIILLIAWGITNRATQISLAARQRIDMVNQLKEQAEIIKERRFAQNVAAFTDDLPANASITTTNPCRLFTESTIVDPGHQPGNNTFHYAVVEGAETVIQPTAGTKLVRNNPRMRVWVQKVSSDDGYIDFYIQGCWLTTGGRQRFDNSIVVMRLNV